MPRRYPSHRAWLRAIAIDVMRERGLEPEFPAAALAEAAAFAAAPTEADEPTRDLRALLWCSIDNDDSRDLDQLSVAERLPNGTTKLFVAVADVDSLVRKGTALDHHAGVNTTSVYTPAIVFSMLPERLSTDLTSLNAHVDRLAIVVEFTVSPDGTLSGGDVYGAKVHNQAQLAYNAVGAWLAGDGPLPPAAAAVPGMDEQLRIQDQAAQVLSSVRHQQGALDFQTLEVQTHFSGDEVQGLEPRQSNRATSLIENLMVAANGVVARFLDARQMPSLRRVVRVPKRWERIVLIAAEQGTKLPEAPDVLALAEFLKTRKAADPVGFPDLSLTIIKLLGSGEYIVDPPGAEPPGHFGLAVKDYTHSTAPNRRYPDLLTQRLLKATLAGRESPYSLAELGQLATRCTEQEDAANKIERRVRKSAAALVMSTRVGERFDAIVTGASPSGVWVRVTSPPVEGRLVQGDKGRDVGDRLRVRLTHVDVDRGFIDFSA